MSRMADPALAEGFDLRRLPEGFIENPYPVYAALREHAPVHVMGQGPSGEAQVLLSRYADLERVYKDAAAFSSDKTVEFGAKFRVAEAGPSPLYRHHTQSLVFNDPPRHTRVRRIIAGALTPRAVAAMEAGIVALDRKSVV